ncbi:MAG: hypothetical protein JXN63_06750 [Candidatus Delongbacteria bacterium]|nr:hypothetical protein [Candidatus Delongbacteria bacterium]
MDKEKKEYEARLQERLKILLEYAEKGKIKVTKDSKSIIDSLVKVRKLPDGTFDLNTVDSAVRSMALCIEYADYRETTKSEATLQEIQHAYIDLLDRTFGVHFKQMLEAKATPSQFAGFLSSRKEIVEQVATQIDEFLNTIKTFWDCVQDGVNFHIDDFHDTHKAVFGGDLFPSNNESIASKCGIYIDTIILPDPYLRCFDLFKYWTPEKQTYYFFKHGLNVLQYKDLIKANIKTPIVIIAPDKGALDTQEKELLQKWGMQDTVKHGSKIFGRDFASFEDLKEFISFYKTPSDLVVGAVDKSRILFDLQYGSDANRQIVEGLKMNKEFLGINNAGFALLNSFSGRFGICNEILIKSQRYRATPIIDAPTSWEYFNWKLEYDANEYEKINNLKHMHILRGLQDVSDNEMTWIGKIPHEALIELRESQAIYEIRDILGKGVDDIIKLEPRDFQSSSNEIIKNIEAAFKQHINNLKVLRDKKWKFALKDIGSWLVTGSLAVAAAATGMPSYGIAAIAVDQLTDSPKLKDIPQSIIKLAKESKEIKRSPIGMLFSYKELGKK